MFNLLQKQFTSM